MKCANCTSPALYVYDPPSVRATPYCDAHLPSFLRQSVRDGSITKAPEFEGARDRALSAMSVPEPAPEAPKTTRRKRKVEATPAPEEATEEAPAAVDPPEESESAEE